MKLLSKFRQRGVTLFELLLVLFVAAFVAVAVATIYNRVNSTYKESVLFNDMQEMAGNIRSLYAAGTTGYTGVSNKVVLDAGIAPPSMVSATTAGGSASATAVNVFGGSWDVSSTIPSEFSITLTGLPTGACTSVGSKGLGGVAASVSSGGSTLTDVGGVAGACNKPGNTNSITFSYT